MLVETLVFLSNCVAHFLGAPALEKYKEEGISSVLVFLISQRCCNGYWRDHRGPLESGLRSEDLILTRWSNWVKSLFSAFPEGL